MLGWKDCQIGVQVKFLGFLVDSLHRRFCIPQAVCEKVKAMIERVCTARAEGRRVSVAELQSLSGKMMSLKLAIPSVSVWLREVIFCEVSARCDPENASTTMVEVSDAALAGLRVLRDDCY